MQFKFLGMLLIFLLDPIIADHRLFRPGYTLGRMESQTTLLLNIRAVNVKFPKITGSIVFLKYEEFRNVYKIHAILPLVTPTISQ